MKKRDKTLLAKALIAVPIAYSAIRTYEYGFDWLTAITAILLVFIVLPLIIVARGKK